MPGWIARASLASMAVLGLAVLGGCGTAPETETVTVTKRAPTSTTVARQKLEPAGSSGRRTATRRAAMLTACDPNVRVKATTTTCGFAENVFYEYWLGQTTGAIGALRAYSPTLRTFLTIRCHGRSTVTCRTSAGALVRFPVSAVSAYTLDTARRYARDHTVTGRPDTGTEPPKPSSGESEKCDANYKGACLDPSSPDYDCAGGSGDGPDYTGRVEVVGDDHFGLDRDGDGVGCES